VELAGAVQSHDEPHRLDVIEVERAAAEGRRHDVAHLVGAGHHPSPLGRAEVQRAVGVRPPAARHPQPTMLVLPDLMKVMYYGHVEAYRRLAASIRP